VCSLVSMQRSRGRYIDMGANGNKDGDGMEPAQYSSRYYRHTVRFRVNEMKRQKKRHSEVNLMLCCKIAEEEVVCWAQFSVMIAYSKQEPCKDAM